MYRRSVVLLALMGICLTAGAAGAAQLVVKVNFQLETAAVPAGYLRDSGDVFGDRGNGYSYGWSAIATSDDRERNANSDKRYDTLVHFSKGSDKTWEIALPNDTYDVFLVCGDASNTDQTNTLDVESVIFTDPDGQDNFDEYSGRVVVKDGRLTIKPAPDASNAKICFIDIVQVVPPNKALDPQPADEATDVPRDVILAWKAAKTAQKHNVFLGADFTDVNTATVTNSLGTLVSEGQTAATYEPAVPLVYGQTYFWRIDEVNAPPSSTISKGDVWSFTVEPYAYPIEKVTATASSSQPGIGGPGSTVDGSGLNADGQHSTDAKVMWLSGGVQPNWIQYEFDKAYKLHELWVWNYNQTIETILGFGAKSVKIEYSLDGTTWTELAGVPEFAKGTCLDSYVHNTVVPFGGAVAKYVKLTILATWGGGGTTGLSEVRFFSIPVQAREPAPATAATGVDLDATLTWRVGREAASHTVYFGTDESAVAGGTAAAKTVADHAFTPADMEFGATYYWRVDEVNDAKTPNLYAGDVWSFTAQEYEAAEDFEAYTDDEGSRIYETWIDGMTTQANGSVVGYMEAPFAEQKIVFGGGQSMPFEYNNIDTPYFSEAEREFSPAQNWTLDGADSVVLHVCGRAPMFVTGADGAITISASGTDIWNNADQFRFAFKHFTGNGSIIVKVESVENTNVWAKAGVMIRESLNADSKFAYMVGTPGSGVSFGWRQVAAAACGSATQAGITNPQWVKLTRTGDVFTAQYSADGKAWTDIKNADGTVTATTITMPGTIYIGLCVTSHNASATTVARFSGLQTTGSVTGNWEAAAIGVAQPANDPGPLYMVVQDSAGKSKVVTHPDPMATTATTWQEWWIPLSEFTSAGVKLNSVKKIRVGVGSPTAPVKGGVGLLYIDDIGFGRQAAD